MHPIKENMNIQKASLVLFFWLFCQLFWLLYIINFFSTQGYLPSPFLYDKSDTFMDFFNTLFWSANDGRYSVWGSVYPPLNFLFLKALNFFLQVEIVDPFITREHGLIFVYALIFFYLLAPIPLVVGPLARRISKLQRIYYYFIMITSAPMLFALERGNLILICVPLVGFLFAIGCEKKNFIIALLINWKPYFLIFILGLSRNFMSLFLIFCASGAIFFLSGLLLGDEDFYLMVINLFSFSQSENLFSLREIIAFPSSIAAFSAILKSSQTSQITTFISNRNLAFMFDCARLALLLASFVALVSVKDTQLSLRKIILITCMIPNLGISVGGYTSIFLFFLLPIVQHLMYRNYYYILLFLILGPLDAIRFGSEDLWEMNVFISGEIILINWEMTLGSFIRPFASYIICAMACYELVQRHFFCWEKLR